MMKNKTLNSFLVMLVFMNFFVIINILITSSNLYKLTGIQKTDLGTRNLRNLRELFRKQEANNPDVNPEPQSGDDDAAKYGGNATDVVPNGAINAKAANSSSAKPARGANAKSANSISAKPSSVAKAEPANDVAKGKPNQKPNMTEIPRPDSCASCFYHNFTYLIQNTSICANSSSEPIELLMLILTVHSNAQQRQNIRNSWASYAKNNTGRVRYAFLLGLTNNKTQMDAVHAESKIYGDILMEDFTDAYANLTYKTIMAMKWMTLFCPQAKYLLKTDDDMWVNVPNLLTLLGRRGRELEEAVGGACRPTAGPIRNQRSKWYASKISYPHSRYPGFCSGTGYVTSAAVAKKVYEVSPNVPFFHLEDVYVALCIKKLGMELLRFPGFHNCRTALKPCAMRSDKMITSHKVPTDFLHEIMKAKCD